MSTLSAPPVSETWNRSQNQAHRPQRRLRARELTLLSAFATGAPITVVAQLLGVSDRTVRRRIRILCEEIGVKTPIEAVVWAARRRLI